MAGDPPPLVVVPLEPLGPTDHVTWPGSGRAPRPAPGLDELEAELFALAWFIGAGDDRLAAHAVRSTMAIHHRSSTGVADPVSQARQLLVRRAVRLGRRAPVTATGDRILDLVFLASARARAAVVLCDGMGLDEASAGQVLGVDRWSCASYHRHALGHGRFVGVPEAVAGRFGVELTRARRDGVPVARPLRFPERHAFELRRIAAAIVVVATVVTWRAAGDPPPVPPSPFLLLDAPGWTVTSGTVADPDTVRAVRVHRRAPAGEAIPPSLVVYGPAGGAAAPPAPASLASAAPGGGAPDPAAAPTSSVVAETVVTPGAERNGWQTFVVQSASCGRTFATAHGLDRADVVVSLRTVSCTAQRDIRLAPPSGAGDELVREAGAVTTTARYARGADTVTVTAWVSDAAPDAPAGPNAVRVLRDSRELVVEAPAFGTERQVRVRVGGTLAVVQGPDALPVDTLVDLAVRLRPADERAWRAALPPPTTTAPATTTTAPPAAVRRYVTGPLPDGHRVASASLATATQPWWRTLGPPSPLGGSSVLEARVEPASTMHDVEGPERPLRVDGRTGRIVIVEDARVPGRPDTDTAVALHAELRDGDLVLHVDAEGVTEADLEAFLRGATIGTDAAAWTAFVEASRQR